MKNETTKTMQQEELKKEELQEGTEIAPNRNIPYKKIIKGIGAFLILYIIWLVIHFFLSPDKNIRQIYLVPQDAVFILQSAEPVKDWHTFSRSDSWNSLKELTFLKETVEQAESLDSLIRENETLLSLVGKRDMIISVHKTRSDDWDALLVIDMQKTSRINLLKSQLENIFRIAGFNVTTRNYKTSAILEAFDPESRDILYTAFVDNHFIASYTSRLVEAAIEEKESPQIGLNPAFQEVEKIVAGRGLYRLYVKYNQLPQFLSIYMEDSEYLTTFSKSMEFSGVHFNIFPEKLEAKGYTIRKDTADPYVTALLNSGKHSMKAHNILSARTALYVNIGFDNPSLFVKQLEKAMSSEDPELYQTYQSSRKKIENLFGISLEDNFLSWMSGEFALAYSETSLLGKEPEIILAIRARKIKDARKNMEIMEKKIKNRTPVRIKTVDYKKYDIHYIEMKGFFRLFFGKLFDKFEKPYYTYLDDYVIFSNSAASLLSFLEDYEQKNLMKNSPVFKKAWSDFANSSTLFLYADIHRFFPQLESIMNRKTWQELQSDKESIYKFPYWSLQLTGENRSAALHYTMGYDAQATIPNMEEEPEDKEMKEEATTEKELMNELKRFYVEKFQGNVLREFHPEGGLKSETEIREGRRHGRHREYYENGKLKLRGKYTRNIRKGTWKYYTEEGKFEKKEKY